MGNINQTGIEAINQRKRISESCINEVGLTRETNRNSTSRALEIDRLHDKLALKRITDDDFYRSLEVF